MNSVSVVMPIYNRRAQFTEAIESALRQTHRPLELVIVNDGSNDGVESVIEVAKVCGKAIGVDVRVIEHIHNQGCGASLKHGFEAATGDYITLLASDDLYLDPESLHRQVVSMSEQGAKWSYYPDRMLGPTVAESRLFQPSFIPKMRFLNKFITNHPRIMCCILFWRNAVNSSSLMIEAETYRQYGGWWEWTKNADCDGALLKYYSYLGLKNTLMPGPAMFYRIHPGQVSNDRESMLRGMERSKIHTMYMIQAGGPFWMVLLSRLCWRLGKWTQ